MADLGPAGVTRCIDEVGIGFCFAPRFHPAMRHAGPVRRELGVPTVFNFLGPLANPARARFQVIGVSDPAMADKMLGVLAANLVRLDEVAASEEEAIAELEKAIAPAPVARIPLTSDEIHDVSGLRRLGAQLEL